jgi:hypothetical protein
MQMERADQGRHMADTRSLAGCRELACREVTIPNGHLQESRFAPSPDTAHAGSALTAKLPEDKRNNNCFASPCEPENNRKENNQQKTIES